uniref:Uncharacterized protein LOC105851261 n=1 Tax=Cicer arietinum TaxID=3827 RepID=A0A1S3DX00_CICAR|nr:uncharacterized protein LOC105851261 [Cicer arietinum]
MDKCKARLVANGFSQRFGVDYTEVYTQFARWDTIRLIATTVAQRNWCIYQLDVKSTFWHGEHILAWEEYNRVEECKSAKELWDTLRIHHEGTSHMKEARIDMGIKLKARAQAELANFWVNL